MSFGAFLAQLRILTCVLVIVCYLEKPIVATAVDAIPDLITDYENGLLVESDSPEKAAAAICEIYENKELKYKLINNGKMRVNAFFDISRVANEHERLIVKISNRGGDNTQLPIYYLNAA